MFRFGRLWLFLCTFLVSGLTRIFADLPAVLPEVGDLQHWSVFTLGSATTADELSGSAVINGDVGVAGIGDINLKDSATINGNLYYRSNGTLDRSSNSMIKGATFHDQDTLLDNDAAAAIAASRHATSLKQHYFAPNDLELSGNRNFTVTAAPGGNVVLKLGNFRMSVNSSLTLDGTATSTFIINVSKQFALSGNAKIVLSGDVQWSNVLFNVYAKDSAVWLSGNSSFAGMLMANRRTVQVSGHTSINGEVIANRVIFGKTGSKGSATVGHPPLVSP